MGTPVIGGDTTGAVLEDSGDIVTGDLDDIGFLSGTEDDTFSITGAASYGTATVDPDTGEWAYDLDDSNPVVDALDDGETLEDVFTVLMVDDDGGTDTQDVTITITGVVCFAAGTLIDTARGPRPVENLAPGDLVHTLDHGLQTLRWRGVFAVDAQAMAANGKLHPVRIAAGALGHGLPRADLRVSRQHRVLVSGAAARAAFGADEVLVPAIKLAGLPGIAVEADDTALRYVHLLFDRHEVVFANGAPTESLLATPQALATMPAATGASMPRAPLAAVPARALPGNGREIRAFRARLHDSGAAVLDPAPVTASRRGARRA